MATIPANSTLMNMVWIKPTERLLWIKVISLIIRETISPVRRVS